jgi:hypothetical protein
MLAPIPRRNREVHLSLASFTTAAFPELTTGRLPHPTFRGLLGVPACLLARLPKAVLYTEVLQRIRYLLHRSDYYRLERPLPGGNRTR